MGVGTRFEDILGLFEDTLGLFEDTLKTNEDSLKPQGGGQKTPSTPRAPTQGGILQSIIKIEGPLVFVL